MTQIEQHAQTNEGSHGRKGDLEFTGARLAANVLLGAGAAGAAAFTATGLPISALVFGVFGAWLTYLIVAGIPKFED